MNESKSVDAQNEFALCGNSVSRWRILIDCMLLWLRRAYNHLGNGKMTAVSTASHTFYLVLEFYR